MIELPPLSGTERAVLWSRALPEASQAMPSSSSTIYPLAPALIDAVGRVAHRGRARRTTRSRSTSRPGSAPCSTIGSAGLATRVTVTQEWDDLVLPDDQTIAVVELLARIRARRRVYEDWGFAEKLGKGLGVTALFSGPPGTGKTMCAGLIAKDLGTELYQVDLGKIVSKWIGETEKNLAALFDAAEAGHAVLLFDEADSLFGKRTAVTSSNDRYANQETNFLLQRHRERSPASASSPRTTSPRSTRRFVAASPSTSGSRCPTRMSASGCGARCYRRAAPVDDGPGARRRSREST